MKRIRSYLILSIALVLLIGVLLAGNYALSPRLPDGEDFLVRWMGARAFLFDQENPYIEESAIEVQKEIYGHPAEKDEYPYRLDTPFYILVFYFPFAFIENFALARSLWMSFAEIALFGVGFLSIHLAKWKISRLNLALFFIALFLSFYGLYPLLIASGVIFKALFLLLALFALQEKWDEALAVLLVFGITYLESGGLVFILIFFTLITSRQWRVFSLMGMSIIALVGFSLIIYPNWLLPFAGAVLANLRATQGIFFSETLQIWLPDRGDLIAQIIKWVAILILILEWFNVRGRSGQHLFWVAGLSLAITPFLGLHITPDIYPFFFFPLALVFKTAQDRWGGKKWSISLALILLTTSWVIYLRVAHAPEILPYLLPLLLIFALYWIRWWIIRPPRMWADKVMKK